MRKTVQQTLLSVQTGFRWVFFVPASCSVEIMPYNNVGNADMGLNLKHLTTVFLVTGNCFILSG